MADEVPHVVGHAYLLALSLLRQGGRRGQNEAEPAIRVRLTRPPRAICGQGQLRVVQQRQEASSARIDLTLAYEGYEEGPRRES